MHTSVRIRYSLPYQLLLLTSYFCHVGALSTSSEPPKFSLMKASKKHGLLHQFERDCSRLSELRPPDPTEDISAPVAIISDGSTYTKLWTEDTWMKHSNPPHKRYARHMWKWRSSKTARKIMPTVLASTLWSIMLSVGSRLYFQSVGKSAETVLAAHGSSAAFSLLSTPLALLLTLRANSSLGRLFEARLLWGRMVLYSRSLANAVRVNIFPLYPQAGLLAARHLAVLGWVLKASVRYESFESEKDVVEIMLGTSSEDTEWLLAQDKRAVAITSRLRQICSAALLDMSISNSASYSSSIQYLIEDKLSNLEQVVGGCQRLSTSPIPPTYSRHLSRVMCLWILLMPVSYVAAGLSTLGVAVAAAVSTYVLVGIDEGGMEIEQVFQLVPLHQLAAAAQNDVKNEFVPNGGDMPTVSML